MKTLRKLQAVILVLAMLFADLAAIAEDTAQLILPAAVQIIDEEAFCGDTSIGKVVVPDGTTEIRSRAFANSSLTELVLPDSITSIAEDAFEGCGSFDVTAPEESYAYSWCEDHGLIREPAPLPAPVLTESQGTVSWTAVEHASGYIAVVSVPDTGYVICRTELTAQTLSFNAAAALAEAAAIPRIYPCSVTALGDGDAYLDSEAACCDILYGVTRLNTPVCEIDGEGILSWLPVANADGYRIIILDASGSEWYAWADADQTSFNLPSWLDYQSYMDWGYYDVSLVAFSDSDLFPESLPSPAMTYRFGLDRLAEPECSFAEGVLTWSAVENAVGYECVISNAHDHGEVSVPLGREAASFDLAAYLAAHPEIPHGTYLVYMCATGDGEIYGDSYWCKAGEYLYGVTRLAAPENASYLDGILSWPAVTNASAYEIRLWEKGYETDEGWVSYPVDEPIPGEETVTADLGSFLRENGYGNRTYTFKLYAQGDAGTYADSFPLEGEFTFVAYPGGSDSGDPSYPESLHPYENLSSRTWTYTYPGAADALAITFHPLTRTESVYDVITITDSRNAVMRYYGTELAGAVVYVKGNTFTIGIESDESMVYYGFAITSIVPATAEEYAAAREFRYTITGSGVVITGYTGDAAQLAIPARISDLDVVGIGDAAFLGNTGLTAVTIPDGVTAVGRHAFANCYYLQDITIPESVLSIDITAFLYASAVLTIHGRLGSYAETFADTMRIRFEPLPTDPTAFTYVVVGEDRCSVTGYTGSESVLILPSVSPDRFTVVTIGEEAFRGRTGLANVWIPESVTSIGPRAFYGCTSLTAVTIPASVTSIGEDAFAGCAEGLKIYTDPGSYAEGYAVSSGIPVVLPSSDPWLFDYESIDDATCRLTRYSGSETVLVLPDTAPDGRKITEIGRIVFSSRGSLTRVVIPEGVTRIGENAFAHCSGLTSVTLPDTLTSIDTSAFAGCTALSGIRIPSGVTELGVGVFADCTALSEVILSEGLTFVGDDMFMNCTSLTTLRIPDTMERIGHYAFSGCTALSGITLSAGLKRIGERAFSSCTSLTAIALPDSLAHIEEGTFSGCGSLGSVTVPSSVNSIAQSAFASAGQELVIIGDAGSCAERFARSNDYPFVLRTADPADFTYSVPVGDTCMILGYHGTKRSVVLPAFSPDGLRIVGIGEGAFRDQTGLTAVVIPEGIYLIDSDAFRGCTGLTAVTIADTVTSIGSGAFCGCCSLTSVVIPEGVNEILSQAFANCAALTKVMIPASVTEIGSDAFFGCGTALAIRGFAGSEAASYASGNGIPFRAFADRSGFTFVPYDDETCYVSAYTGIESTVVIPPRDEDGHTVTGIGEYAFCGNTALVSVEIPDSVTGIDAWAFAYCTELTEISLPDGLTWIGDNAFNTCSSLEEISFPDSIRAIPESCVSDCASLRDVTIPEGISEIDSRAFGNCGALTCVDIPMSVMYIAEDAFSGCGTGLTIRGASGFYAVEYAASHGIGFAVTDPVIADAADFVYEVIDEDFCRVIGYSGSLQVLVIPSAAPDGRTVKEIGERAFLDRTDLFAVVIPRTVTEIGESAFQSCRNLCKVSLPDALTVIGEAAFADCAFESISIPEGVTSFGASAFEGCWNLEEIDLPEHMTMLGSGVFARCYDLKSITVPSGVTVIEMRAFSGCVSLKDIVLPEGVTGIGWNAFESCTGLGSVTLPESLVSISEYAFWNCTALSSIMIPAGVTQIGPYAFTAAGEEQMTGLIIYGYPGSAAQSFAAEYGFSFIAVTPQSDFSFTQTGDRTCSVTGYHGTGTSAVIPQTDADGRRVTEIAADAFRGHTELTEVVIPVTVTGIGNGAFYGCTALAGIVIPGKVSRIAEGTFGGCTGLTNVVLPEELEGIGSRAFADCAGLAPITIPYSVVNIADDAFDGCVQGLTIACEAGSYAEGFALGNDMNLVLLTTDPSDFYYMHDYNDEHTCRISGYHGNRTALVLPAVAPDGYTVAGISANAFYCREDLTRVVIPEGVTSIGQAAFYTCRNMTSVVIPSTVTEIGIESFAFCESLREVTIPYGVTQIPAGAFSGCSDLTSVVIPATVAALDHDAFGCCYSLQSVVLPVGLTEIGRWAFGSCTALSSVTLPDGLLTIGQNAFSGCSDLISVVIPDTVTALGQSVFDNCAALASVTLSAGLTEIAAYLFENCPSLTEVVIPDGVVSIGNNVFSGCSGLVSVCIPDSVTAIDPYAFNGLSGDLTIRCSLDSPAESYAEANGFTVDLITADPSDLTFEATGGTTCRVTAYSGNDAVLVLPAADPEGRQVTGIGDQAFLGNTVLTAVRIPDTVTSIGARAFSGCGALKRVVIPEGLISIGQTAFGGCTSLEGITIPASVTEIGEGTFDACSASLVIFGYAGTCAESFANENGFTFSDLQPADPVPLAIPQLTEAGGVISWPAVDYALGYYVNMYIGDMDFVTGSNVAADVCSFDAAAYLEANDLANGVYLVTVIALGDNTCYSDSAWADIEVMYHISRLELTGVTVTDNGVGSWTAAEHATGYIVRISLSGHEEEISHEIRLTSGVTTCDAGAYLAGTEDPKGIYSFDVCAVGDGENWLDSLHYCCTFAYGFTRLPAPELSIEDSAVSWSAVGHASGYRLTICDAAENIIASCDLQASECSCDLDDLLLSANCPYGEYFCSLCAVGDGDLYADSDLAAWSYVYSFATLGEPEVALSEGVITWSLVEHAVGYKMFVRDADWETVDELALGDGITAFDAQEYLELAGYPVGVYYFGVCALGGNTGWADSIPSNVTVLYGLTALEAPECSIAGSIVSWDAVDDASGYRLSLRSETGLDLDVTLLPEVTEYDVAPLLTEQSYPKGLCSISVYALGDGTEYADSDAAWAVEYAFGVLRLELLFWQVSGTRLVWSGAENASGYEVHIWRNPEELGFDERVILGADTYSLDIGAYLTSRGIASGVFDLDVRALGDGETYIHGPWGNDVYFHNMRYLDTPEWTLTDGLISWQAVDHASGYSLYMVSLCRGVDFREELLFDTDELCFDLAAYLAGNELPHAIYDITLWANGDNITYLDSNWQEQEYAYGLTRLDALEVSVNEGVISWTAADHAVGYLLNIQSFENGLEFDEYIELDASAVTYDAAAFLRSWDILKGDLSFTICAMGDMVTYADGPNSSNRLLIGMTQLEPPTFTWENGVITWGAVAHASQYLIIIWDEEVSEPVRLQVTVPGDSVSYDAGAYMQQNGCPAGDYFIDLYARGDGEDYVSSEPARAQVRYHTVTIPIIDDEEDEDSRH